MVRYGIVYRYLGLTDGKLILPPQKILSRKEHWQSFFCISVNSQTIFVTYIRKELGKPDHWITDAEKKIRERLRPLLEKAQVPYNALHACKFMFFMICNISSCIIKPFVNTLRVLYTVYFV